jgi:uncharacterized protein (TIGR03905 family)
MSERISYNTKGTCSRQIEIEIENGIVTDVKYIGGCSGNTQGISALVKGLPIDEVIARLDGIRCGYKPTSCPDQLANALKQYKTQKSE